MAHLATRLIPMDTRDAAKSAAAIHRKLRALRAILVDRAATEHEKANAAEIKARLEDQLRDEAGAGHAWTGVMFRLGRGVREIANPPAPTRNWTDHCFRAGRVLRGFLKK
jgi:hypothetical protein